MLLNVISNNKNIKITLSGLAKYCGTFSLDFDVFLLCDKSSRVYYKGTVTLKNIIAMQWSSVSDVGTLSLCMIPQ